MTEEDNPETYSGLSFSVRDGVRGRNNAPRGCTHFDRGNRTGKTGTSTPGKEYINAGKGACQQRKGHIGTGKACWERK